MRRLPRQLPLVLSLIVGAACGPPHYVAPSLDEPHALVTVRVIHHQISGQTLAHLTLIDGQSMSLGERQSAVRGVPLTRSVRVRPTQATWRFQSVFSHTEHRTETVYEREQYACGTQTSGYGASTRNSTRYCSRQVPRQRSRSVNVTDGACESTLGLRAGAGRRYVLQFDYHGNGSCRARCFEQVSQPDGRFNLSPCRSAGSSAATGSTPAAPPPSAASVPAAPTHTPTSGTPRARTAGRALDAP